MDAIIEHKNNNYAFITADEAALSVFSKYANINNKNVNNKSNNCNVNALIIKSHTILADTLIILGIQLVASLHILTINSRTNKCVFAIVKNK